MKRSSFVISLIGLTLLLDQSLKIWVKLNMALGDAFRILGWDWFQIHFTENPGMAFGIELGIANGKLILTLFRIVVVSFIGYFLGTLIRKNASYLLLSCIALIFAGAIGNIIDSVFYGVLFSDSGNFHSPRIASFLPAEGGYAAPLYGKVVDMLYFPLYSGTWPDWMPWVGGQYFQFFQPVFNIADTAISIGVAMAILFYKRFQLEIEPPIIENSSLQKVPTNAEGTNDASPDEPPTLEEE